MSTYDLERAARRVRQADQDISIYRDAMAAAHTRERFEDALNACVKARGERDVARSALLDAASDGGYTELFDF